jgi:hypothetical protein
MIKRRVEKWAWINHWQNGGFLGHRLFFGPFFKISSRPHSHLTNPYEHSADSIPTWLQLVNI